MPITDPEPMFDMPPEESGCCPTQVNRTQLANGLTNFGFTVSRLKSLRITRRGILVEFYQANAGAPASIADQTDTSQVWTTFVPFAT